MVGGNGSCTICPATICPARHKPRKGKRYMFCPSCGKKYAEGNSSCRFCYRLLPSDSDDNADGTATAICPSCGKKTEADCFCRFCGSLFPPDLPVDPLRRAPDFTQTEGYKYRAGLRAKLAAQNQANLPTQKVQTDIAKAARKEATGRKCRTYRIAMLEY